MQISQGANDSMLIDNEFWLDMQRILYLGDLCSKQYWL